MFRLGKYKPASERPNTGNRDQKATVYDYKQGRALFVLKHDRMIRPLNMNMLPGRDSYLLLASHASILEIVCMNDASQIRNNNGFVELRFNNAHGFQVLMNSDCTSYIIRHKNVAARIDLTNSRRTYLVTPDSQLENDIIVARAAKIEELACIR